MIKEFTRKAIRNAVISVMAEHGQGGITMKRVAEEAGVAKGTLYLYYKNKEELLRDTIDWCVSPLIEGGKEIFAADIEPEEKVTRLIGFHHQFFREHQKLFKMLLVDQQITRSNEKRQENELYQKVLQKFSDLIQEGIDRGVFKSVNPMAVATIIMESNIALTYQYLKSETKIGSTESSDILKEIFLKGILTQ